jgi:hypothetical protein
VLDEQAEDRQPGFLSERTERAHDGGGVGEQREVLALCFHISSIMEMMTRVKNPIADSSTRGIRTGRCA